MYGLINSALQDMIREKFGDEQWQRVLERSGVPDDSFLTMRSYDDQVTFDLAVAASEVLEAPLETCLEMFGVYWIEETASKSYGPLMEACGSDMVEFLHNLNTLHDRITSTFLDYRPPEFQVEELADGKHRVHYVSERKGLVPFVTGLLKGLAQRFQCELDILEQRDLEVSAGSHAVFEIRFR